METAVDSQVADEAVISLESVGLARHLCKMQTIYWIVREILQLPVWTFIRLRTTYIKFDRARCLSATIRTWHDIFPPRRFGEPDIHQEKSAQWAPFSTLEGWLAQRFLISKFCSVTDLPSSEISTLYLPSGQRSGFCTLKVVTAGPSVAIDWLTLLTIWPVPSR